MFRPVLRSMRPLRASIPATRSLHASRISLGVQEITRPEIDTPLSLWNFTEEEDMLRDTGRYRAPGSDVNVPLTHSQAIRAGCDRPESSRDGREGGDGPGDHQGVVRERRECSARLQLADKQLMGIETSADHDGSECSFTSAIIAVEELAKVDPSVAVLVDVHNTLVNTVLRLYGNDEIKSKWLPDLATSKVCQS